MQFRCTCGEILSLLTKNHSERKHGMSLDDLLQQHPELKPYSVNGSKSGFNRGPKPAPQITASKQQVKAPKRQTEASVKQIVEKEPRSSYSCKCKAEGCPDNAENHGFCGKHWMRFKRYGDVNVINRRGPKPRGRKCTFPGCNEDHRAKGYCETHYQTMKRKDFIKWW